MDNLKEQWDLLNGRIDDLNSERIALLDKMIKAGWAVEDLLQPIELTQGRPVHLGPEINY